MRRALYVLAMTYSLAFAQSQPPSPCPVIRENQQEGTEASNKQADDQNRGTENAPVFVKVIPPDNAAEKEKYETTREEQKTAIEHRNAVANMVMAAGTLVIVVFTIGLYLTGRNTAIKQLRAYSRN